MSTEKSVWFFLNEEEQNSFNSPIGFSDAWKPWPGSLEEGPSISAEVFSREFIQNSWDAMREFQSLKGRHYQSTLQFRFIRLTDGDSDNFCEKFGINYLKKRYDNLSKDEKIRLQMSGSVIAKAEISEINVLVVSETYTPGMPGKWNNEGRINPPGSKMKVALVSSSTQKNDPAAGGSYGKGKGGVCLGSNIRTIGAYTCFEEQEYEKGVSRRFLGASFWADHNDATHKYLGLGVLAERKQEGRSLYRPFENEVADGFINELKLPLLTNRSSLNESELGTSFIIPDPSMSPNDLADAIARNWWPVLHRGKLSIEIRGYKDEIIPINYQTKTLKPFIRAFDVAIGNDSANLENEVSQKIVQNNIEAGLLGIIADPEVSWQSDIDGEISVIALVRNDMVIQYLPSGYKNSKPFLRGTLIVDSDSNMESSHFLKNVEPYLHNFWDYKNEKFDSESRKFAEGVLEKVNKSRLTLHKKLKESMPVSSFNLSAFSKYFISKDKSNKPVIEPSTPKEKFYIVNNTTALSDRDKTDHSLLRIQGDFTLSLPKSSKNEDMDVSILIGWKVYEESGPVKDELLLDAKSIEIPQGFVQSGRFYVGRLTKTTVQFKWKSTFYPDYWSIVPEFEVTPLADTQTSEGN